LSQAFTGELTAEWETTNTELIIQQQRLYERLPQLLLLAFLHEKQAKSKAAKTALLVTALMKYVFLFQMEATSRRRLYHFIPYHYGPFAKELYTDLEALREQGFITIDNGDDIRTRITLTESGELEALFSDLPDDIKEDVAFIEETYGEFSHSELLHEVYEKYPAYAQKSRLKEATEVKCRCLGDMDLFMKTFVKSDEGLKLDPASGSGAFLRMTMQNSSSPDEHIPSGNLAVDAINKLNGVWSVQLFFRTWPYYAQRATTPESDQYKHFNTVLSENLPALNLPPDLEAQLNTYTKQLWAMCIVYIEAILEHYFLGIIENLKLEAEEKRLPRQAGSLLRYLKRNFNKKYGGAVSISSEDEWQLCELTATRHLWVHLSGVVDEVYVRDTDKRMEGRPNNWDKVKSTLGSERLLSAEYIKGSIYFSKKLISIVDEQITKSKPQYAGGEAPPSVSAL
jgi:uncharacterized protein YwgA